MRRLFNMFKIRQSKSENKLESQLPIQTSPKPVTMTINNVEYTIKDDLNIKVQSSADDVNVYGWSLETRYKFNDERWSSWYTYYNHRIYHSRETAIDAAIKAGLGRDDKHEYRVTALYQMNEPQYREYKIDKLLGSRKPKQTYEIKGWKLKEDLVWYKNPHNGYEVVHKKGTVYIQLEDGGIIRSGVTQYTHHVGRDKLFKELIPNGLVEEISIKDEKWLHPHLLKELKIKLKLR